MAERDNKVAAALLAYEPSLRERIGNATYDVAKYLGLPYANRMRGDIETAVDFIPGVGDVVGVNEAARDYQAGNYLGALGGMGLTAVGAVPAVGDLTKKAASELMDRAAARGVDLFISAPRGRLVVDKIVVPKAARGQGYGTQIMNEILATADQLGAPVSLTPSADFGGSVSRLKKFYGGLGFEPNAGRTRDFEISETMRRYPVKKP